VAFECGHVISEFNGGTNKLNNLKPICVSCNSSMGTQNMDEFIKNCGL
jgi:5-methylcytosine-specific restriction endonuclease McrA